MFLQNVKILVRICSRVFRVSKAVTFRGDDFVVTSWALSPSISSVCYESINKTNKKFQLWLSI